MRLTLPAFFGYGIELEYMIVDRTTLSILPIAEKVLQRISETCASGLRRGELAWSHELVLQAIETDALVEIMHACLRSAEEAVITNAEYLRRLGFPGHRCDAVSSGAI